MRAGGGYVSEPQALTTPTERHRMPWLSSGGSWTATDRALAALAYRVGTTSDDHALRLAFRAYYAFAAEHPAEIRNPYLFFVDYGLDDRTPRGWVFDMKALTLVNGPFTVSHGAPYVTAGDAGRSQGCPAMEQARARRLLPMIANGGLVFLYSPRDRSWLGSGPWVRAAS